MDKEQQYSLGVISPPSFVTFMMTNGTDEAMRITKDGVWVNPTINVDEAASAVIEALDNHIKALVKRQPLSDDEIVKALRDDDFKWPASAFEIARAIEAAHGITNEP